MTTTIETVKATPLADELQRMLLATAIREGAFWVARAERAAKEEGVSFVHLFTGLNAAVAEAVMDCWYSSVPNVERNVREALQSRGATEAIHHLASLARPEEPSFRIPDEMEEAVRLVAPALRGIAAAKVAAKAAKAASAAADAVAEATEFASLTAAAAARFESPQAA